MKTRLPAVLAALSLAAFALALVPAADAHTCTGNAGGLACGPCLPPSAHNHRGLDGSSFCSSEAIRVCYLGICLP